MLNEPLVNQLFRSATALLLTAMMIGGSIAKADDGAINQYVNSALEHDQRIDTKHVQVTTRDGVVTLSGQVATLAAKKFAVREAGKIRDVVAVTDEVTISAEQRSDVDIVNDVRQRIAHDATIVSKNLTVGCLDGYVTLSGEVSKQSRGRLSVAGSRCPLHQQPNPCCPQHTAFREESKQDFNPADPGIQYKGHKFKGTIEAVGDGKLTLRGEDDGTGDFFVIPETTITRDEKPAELEDLQPDDVAIIAAVRQGSRMIALSVFVMEPQ